MDLVGEEDAGAGEIIPKQALYVKKTWLQDTHGDNVAHWICSNFLSEHFISFFYQISKFWDHE